MARLSVADAAGTRVNGHALEGTWACGHGAVLRRTAPKPEFLTELVGIWEL